MSRSIGSLLIVINASTKRLEKALSRSESMMMRSAARMERIGGRLTQSITLPFLAAAGAGARFTLQTEESFSKIENLVGVSGKALTKLKGQVAGLSVEVGKSQKELSDALFVVTSAGARENAFDILEKSAKASAIGLGETKDVARAVTAAMTAYKDSELSAARATNILVGAVRAGNFEASEFAPAIGRVLGLSAKLGISFEELSASVATYTRLGGNVNDAITAYGAILKSVLNPTKESREALAQMGFTAAQVRRMVGPDGPGLAKALQILVKATEGNDDALGDWLPNIQALRGVLSTAGTQAKTYSDILGELKGNTDLLNEGFDNVSKKSFHRFRQALVQLQNLSMQLAAEVLPIFERLAGLILKAIQRFKSLSPEVQQNIIKYTMLAAAAGPVLTIFGSLLRVGAGLLGNVFKPMVRTVANLSKSLLSMGAKGGVIGLVVAGLATGAVLIVKNWSKVKGYIVRATNAFIDLYNTSKLFQGVIDTIKFSFHFLVDGAMTFFNVIKGGLSTLIAAGSALKDGEFKKAFGELKGGFSDLGDVMDAFNERTQENFEKIFSFEELKKIKESDVEAFFSPVTDFMSSMSAKVKTFYNDLFGGGIGGGTRPASPAAQDPAKDKKGGAGLNFMLVNPEQLKKLHEVKTAMDAIRGAVGLVGGAMNKARGYIAPAIGELSKAAAKALEIGQVFKQTFKREFAENIARQFSAMQVPYIGETRENIRLLNAELAQQNEILASRSSSEEEKDRARVQMKLIKGQIKAEKERGNVLLQTARAAINAARDSVKAAMAAALAKHLQNVLSGPGLWFVNLIAAPAAMAAAKGLFDKFIPSLSRGGILSKPTHILAGDTPGASRGNPEVFAPLKDLKAMIADAVRPSMSLQAEAITRNINPGIHRRPQPIQVEGQIMWDGKDFAIKIERAIEDIIRQRGVYG